MKKPNFIIVLACLVLIAGVLSFSQEGKADRATVSFSDPSKPGFIELSVHRGSITVKGYNGKEVIIEARAVTRKLKDRNEEAILREFARTARTRARAEVTDEEKKEKKTEGMRQIQTPLATGLSVEEEDNKMEVDVSSVRQAVDLTLQVPYSTSLELSAHTDGDITVENIAGDIEVNHHAGALNLTGISGTVVRQADVFQQLGRRYRCHPPLQCQSDRQDEIRTRRNLQRFRYPDRHICPESREG